MWKKLWLLCLLVLAACTYLPDLGAAPAAVPCPTQPACPPAVTMIVVAATPVPATPEPPAPVKTQPAPVVPTEVAPAAEGAAPRTAMPFVVEPGTPRLEENFAHPDLGCAWVGLIGQVLDEQGEALPGQVVVVTGALNDQVVDAVGLSGAASQYGPGGFEIQLPAQLAVTSQLHVQLFDLDGAPLSESVLFDPPAACERTLVLVNFRLQP